MSKEEKDDLIKQIEEDIKTYEGDIQQDLDSIEDHRHIISGIELHREVIVGKRKYAVKMLDILRNETKRA